MFNKNFNVDCSHYLRNTSPNVSSASNLVSIGGNSPSVLNGCYSNSFSRRPFQDLMTYFFDNKYFVEVLNPSGEKGIAGGTGVVFGDGNVAPTVDDITLSGNPILGLSSSNITISASVVSETTYYEKTCIYTIHNDTGADITIGEIGLFCSFYGQKRQYYSDYVQCPYMIERTALESPVTIPAGGVGQVTYTIRINYPVN